jgi:hypothetical protein
LPRRPSTTARGLHPTSRQRTRNTAKALHAACLYLTNDRHHVGCVALSGRFVGSILQFSASIWVGRIDEAQNALQVHGQLFFKQSFSHQSVRLIHEYQVLQAVFIRTLHILGTVNEQFVYSLKSLIARGYFGALRDHSTQPFQ